MVEKARIGVIGVGYIGDVHIRSLQATGKAEVVAIADVDERTLRARQREHGISGAYLDYRDMLDGEVLDGVIVATPDEVHRGPVEAVAGVGLPLLLEKPIATNAEDAHAIVGAVEDAGIRCLMGFCLRFKADYASIKEKFDGGELGEPLTAYMRRACPVEEARRLSGRCSVNDYLAVHDIDFLLWVFGTDVESIFAVRSDLRLRDELGTSDLYWNTLKWQSGATGSILATWSMPNSYPLILDSEALLLGSKGSAQVSSGLAGQQAYFATDDSFDICHLSGPDMYERQCSHFVDVALGTAEPLATIYDGLNAFRLIEAAEQSVNSDRPVKVAL